ncbi:unnamed protein product [Vitrella brassicaformis CCMP3155]|uniref:Proteasome subunit beta n=2 Tax=Vitrella brassicaformis TaxID=1169539 RepID=A0A0G4EDP7_VITBC|nr:unnamed protein product [Vitrella brassicaformis CCMP3155]|eukprot:CEL93850.1 unnamed protein product [Vitrella brassicaformis CCMP3155]
MMGEWSSGEGLQQHMQSHGSVPRPVSNPPMEHRFMPYQNNGGTVFAVAGPTYAVAMADTRLSSGMRILSRNTTKCTQLTSKCVVLTGGMQAEMVELHKRMKILITQYEHAHRREPSVNAVAQLLSTRLYFKRFFPYYTFNVVVGLDEEGKGAVYGYDAIGSFERIPYVSQGTGAELVTSVLDNQIGKTNQTKQLEPLDKTDLIDLAKDVIAAAGERDIYTGDYAEVYVIDETGVNKSKVDLRKE